MRQVQRWPWERIGRGKLLLRCVCSAAREALGRPQRRREVGRIVSPRAQLVMPPPLIGGDIKRYFCLTSHVCLSRTSGLSREQIGLRRPKLPRHTWLGHHFQGQKVKGQGHQAALLTAVLALQSAAAVGVRTCWPWETADTLPSARRRKALRRPRGGEERGGTVGAYRGGRPPTACYNLLATSCQLVTDKSLITCWQPVRWAFPHVTWRHS